MDTLGIHLQTQQRMQNTSWEQTGVPEQWKRTYRTTQNSVGQGTRGKNRSVSRTGPALGRRGNWNRGLIPTAGQLSESEEKHLRLRVKQLTCGSLNGMRIRQSLLATMHTLDRGRSYPGQGCRSPGRHSGWELEFRDCGAIPGRRLLLTAERWIEGMWGRRLWWKISVVESQAAMEARRYCWVTRSGWSHHHSLSPHRPASAAAQ